MQDEIPRVMDKGAEVSLKLNNILTALILMVMSWIGVSIEGLKDAVGKQSTALSVNSLQIEKLEDADKTILTELSRMKADTIAIERRVSKLER